MRELRGRERELGEQSRYFDCVVSSKSQMRLLDFSILLLFTYIQRFAKDAVDVVRDG